LVAAEEEHFFFFFYTCNCLEMEDCRQNMETTPKITVTTLNAAARLCPICEQNETKKEEALHADCPLYFKKKTSIG
jgi:hypothetical protein